MKKNLLTIGLVAASLSVQAQNILLHVDDTAKMFVSEGTLVYNGGGLQTRGSGIIDNHGNLMIVGASSDLMKTIDTNGNAKYDGSNIVLRINDRSSTQPTSYGQLYIDGISQANITAIVSKEFKDKAHGSGNYFQQIAIPFEGKELSTLSTEFAKTFGTTRWTQDEILTYNNTHVVSNHFTSLGSTTTDAMAYYMLGSKNNNLNTSTPPSNLATIAPTPTGSVYTISGKPYSSFTTSVTLQNAGANVNFGQDGNGTNQYNERYNTYLQDQFSLSNGAWVGDYGKNIYQFGNPFLTNLDLSKIGIQESATIGDGNYIGNIWGVRYDPGTVTTLSNGSTYSTGALVSTFTNGVVVGDVGMIIKPMQTFVIKLRDNNDPQTLNFNTLRRFSNVARSATTDYSVTAARTSANRNGQGSVKQLGIVALNADGVEVGRTYYVVSPRFTTGHHTNSSTSVQATATNHHIIGTFEEAPNGGYDFNYTSAYWLYINEANENDFSGKNVKLVNYDYGDQRLGVTYRFEILEDAVPVAQGTHLLSAGKGFYYKTANGSLQPITHGSTAPILGDEYDLYYGEPSNLVLSTQEAKKPSRTTVVYNPEIKDYIVRFDPNWKKANIQVYDLSGKLVLSKTDVSTSKDFVIQLDASLKNAYVVKVVSENGEVVNAKILK